MNKLPLPMNIPSLYTEVYRKNAAAQLEEQAPAFTPTVRTPQCGHTVCGNKPDETLT